MLHGKQLFRNVSHIIDAIVFDCFSLLAQSGKRMRSNTEYRWTSSRWRRGSTGLSKGSTGDQKLRNAMAKRFIHSEVAG